MRAETSVDLRVECPLCLLNCSQIWHLSTTVSKHMKYQILWKYAQRFSNCSMKTGGHDIWKFVAPKIIAWEVNSKILIKFDNRSREPYYSIPYTHKKPQFRLPNDIDLRRKYKYNSCYDKMLKPQMYKLTLICKPSYNNSASIKYFQNFEHNPITICRDGVVGIATGYGLDDRGVGVRVPVRSRIFSSPCRPDRLWDPPNLISNGYLGLIPQG
jgi:hypothetical protein